MRTTLSKPSADIAVQTRAEIEDNALNLAIQSRGAAMLAAAEPRTHCLLCGTCLARAEGFVHRGVGYVACPACHHVQSRGRPPADGFPPTSFDTVYPPLDRGVALARVTRIYLPKLEWVLAQVDLLGTDRRELLSRRWFEIGCGAGYFLCALTQAGAGRIGGADRNDNLAKRTNQLLGYSAVQPSRASFADTVRAHPADVYVAWFVLEHVEDARAAWEAMRETPPGTQFVLSVPMMGLATLIEGAVDGYASRSLDNAVHVQLYTDRSLARAMKMGGLELVAEWLFGQDIQDLGRLLSVSLAKTHAPSIIGPLLERLTAASDAMQAAVDRARLCDASHIIARRV
jgi:hypothetical protein